MDPKRAKFCQFKGQKGAQGEAQRVTTIGAVYIFASFNHLSKYSQYHFYLVNPDPKLIQNPKYYILLESLYNFRKKLHLRILNLVIGDLEIATEKKCWQKN